MNGGIFTLKRFTSFVFILFAMIFIPLNIIQAVYLEFTQKYVYNEGTYYRARAVAATDIDEDGDMDVIVGDSYYDDLIWYKNNGSETFSRVVIDSTYDRAAQIEIMDLDEDGDLDIIGGDNDAYQIKWWENDGAENFTEQVVSSYGSDFTIHDIDDDGDYDFVAPDWSSGLYWVENNGSEVFTNRLINASYTAAWTTCAGDMNGDTTEDIVFNRYNGNLYLLTNDGSESFTETTIDTGNVAKTLACVSLDGDADIDIISAHSYGGDIIWFDNNGSGTFTEKTVISGSYGTDDFKVIDLDTDGDLDIVTADDTNHKVLWFENNGSETFTERTVDTYYNGVTTVDVADIDGDTDLDVVAGSYENGQDVMWFQAALDTTNPGISTLSPANDSAGAATTSDLVITFDEAVDAETGFIKLYKADTTLIQSFNVTSDISGSGTTTITANPTSDLDEQTEYYIQIDATAFDDPTGNSFAGIADETTWDFTTADETSPSISTLSPANSATGVAIDSNLVVTFDEAVNVETGNVILYKAGHQEVESIDITSGQVTGDGTSTITINPSSDLQELYVYYLYINATAIDDLNGNSFAGIADDSTWTFTTTGTAGVTVSTASGNTNEAAATATFTVVLDTEPTANVTIPVSSSDTGEGTVSDSTLTFTPGDWNTPQTITVTGVNDDLDDGNQAYNAVLGSTTSSDGNYNGLNPSDVSLTNEDNDTFGVTKSQTSLTLTEGGTSDTYTLVLNTEPTADVTITLDDSNNDITVSPSTLTFTSANWDTTQTVTVSPVDDDIDEDSHTDAVTHTAASSDSNYNNTTITNVNISLTDNDTAGITTTGTDASLTEGASTTYTLVLDSEPTNDVTVSLSSANSEVTPTSSVTFTSANWDTAQTITLTATDDTDYEGDHSDTVAHSVTSDDSNYNSYSLTDLTISITDNDEEPVEETPEEEETEEVVPEDKEEVGELESSPTGPGQVTIYDKDSDEIHCTINAWSKGGAIGKFMQTLDQDQVAVVKNRYGSTVHIYDLNCNLIDKKRLSPKIHPRQMAIRNFIGGSNSQEIVLGSRRGSTLYLKAFRYNQNKNEWYLLREKSFRPVPINYTLEKTSKGYVQIKSSKGKVLHTWKMKKTSANDTKIVI